MNQLDDLLHQVGVGNQLAFAEVHERVVDAVALRAPDVLRYQHVGVGTPALVVAPPPVQHVQ